MSLRNEDGAALILVLLFLLVGTVLVGALFTSVRGHISTSVHEESIAKAFHNADSGVEFINSRLNQIQLNDIEENYSLKLENGEIEFNSADNWIDGEDLGLDESKIKFKITADDLDNENGDFFISKGLYRANNDREYTQEIRFAISFGSGSGMRNFNIQDREIGENDEYYRIDGQDGDIKKAINIDDWGTESFAEFSNIFLNDDFFDFDDPDNLKFDTDKFVTIDSKIENDLKDSIIYVASDLEISHSDVENSIIVINGKMEMGAQTNIINSVIIVRDYVEMSGASSAKDWENPTFSVFGKNSKSHGNREYYLRLSGVGSFDVGADSSQLPDDFRNEVSISSWEQL
ncbi:hypothetical protein LJ207_00130 [Halanaerobium sp. Z-7514]|uniref:Type 4 fimbrial biogenesis protein PilX N-terminal domain-containing protein n=1 Tax=Halanaerobium polyolivorans TaxID=2886943 RepID=A0AAW4WWV4_9FIRM|nr:hypothetical protein [Halanaerobium polyolivorans]MCC3143732.1 hypothetical protein [Halanaerobium polyolivorans]